jgi:hypothetical protein
MMCGVHFFPVLRLTQLICSLESGLIYSASLLVLLIILSVGRYGQASVLIAAELFVIPLLVQISVGHLQTMRVPDLDTLLTRGLHQLSSS